MRTDHWAAADVHGDHSFWSRPQSTLAWIGGGLVRVWEDRSATNGYTLVHRFIGVVGERAVGAACCAAGTPAVQPYMEAVQERHVGQAVKTPSMYAHLCQVGSTANQCTGGAMIT